MTQQSPTVDNDEMIHPSREEQHTYSVDRATGHIVATPTVDDYVAQYVKLRDFVKTQTDAFEERLKQYKAAMELIENQLGQKMIDDGVESFKTAHGTAYKTTTLSVRTADKDAFTRYVIGAEKWDLVDMRPLKEGVKDFMEENGDAPPPGVDVTFVSNVRVRRS